MQIWLVSIITALIIANSAIITIINLALRIIIATLIINLIVISLAVIIIISSWLANKLALAIIISNLIIIKTLKWVKWLIFLKK